MGRNVIGPGGLLAIDEFRSELGTCPSPDIRNAIRQIFAGSSVEFEASRFIVSLSPVSESSRRILFVEETDRYVQRKVVITLRCVPEAELVRRGLAPDGREPATEWVTYQAVVPVNNPGAGEDLNLDAAVREEGAGVGVYVVDLWDCMIEGLATAPAS